MIDGVFNGSLKSGDTFPSVLNLVGKTLQDSIEYGFGGMLADADFKTPDGEMLLRLTKDVWQFSAAKNYSQLHDMTLALTDADGNMRNYADFKEAATAINEKYNNAWLKTEYNLAVNSSTMAARWVDFEKNKADMPFLQYSTVGDGNVRPEHQVLNGIIRKVDDSFWNTHYPPNGWNCRCDVRQLATSYAQETVGLPDIVIPSMFRTNLAKTGLVFPRGSAYYVDTPRSVLIDALPYLPEDAMLSTKDKWSTGKKLYTHTLHGADEIDGNIEIAKLHAKHLGYKHNITLLPEIGGDMPLDKRKKVYGKDVFDNKCPDARINGELWDYQQFTTTWETSGSKKSFSKYYDSKIKHALRDKGKQALNIVLVMSEDLDESIISRAVNGYLNLSHKTRKVTIIQNNNNYDFATKAKRQL